MRLMNARSIFNVSTGRLPLYRFHIHAGVKLHEVSLTAGLGLIHGDIRVAQQIIGPFMRGLAYGNADAGRNDHFTRTEQDGERQDLRDAVGNGTHVHVVGDAFQQNDELIAAQSLVIIMG
jgi:hypothetical protein